MYQLAKTEFPWVNALKPSAKFVVTGWLWPRCWLSRIRQDQITPRWPSTSVKNVRKKILHWDFGIVILKAVAHQCYKLYLALANWNEPILPCTLLSCEKNGWPLTLTTSLLFVFWIILSWYSYIILHIKVVLWVCWSVSLTHKDLLQKLLSSPAQAGYLSSLFGCTFQ